MSQATSHYRCVVCCAVGAAAWLFAGALRAEPIEAREAETTAAELEGPLDFSPLAGASTQDRSYTPKQRPAWAPSTGWNAKVGVDHRTPAMPLPITVPDQSSGVAWLRLTAPTLPSPLSWDQAAIETRIDPQEQGRVGMVFSRSLPVSGWMALTLQNGYAITQTLPHAAIATGVAPGTPHNLDINHALRFRVLPADTTFSFGAASSSTEEKWLRSLSAEQRLFGGPVSVTGTLSETTTGETSKSLKAGFKRTW